MNFTVGDGFRFGIGFYLATLVLGIAEVVVVIVAVLLLIQALG